MRWRRTDGGRSVWRSQNRKPPPSRTIVWDSPHPRERQESSQHIETLYVDRPQFATLLLPLTSTGFYPDGNSPGKSMENSGKQNPKMGFKSPPSRDSHL